MNAYAGKVGKKQFATLMIRLIQKQDRERAASLAFRLQRLRDTGCCDDPNCPAHGQQARRQAN